MDEPWPRAAQPAGSHDQEEKRRPVSVSAQIRAVTSRRAVSAALALSTVCWSWTFPPLLAAEVAGESAPADGVQFSLSATPLYQFKANVDGGGTLSVARYVFGADVSGQITGDLRLGLGLTYAFDDYDFSGLTGFSIPKPWNQVQTFGASVPLIYSVTDKWTLFLSPAVQFSGESGATWRDAISYGGIVSGSYAFRPDFTLGVGVGAFSNLGKAEVFPYVVVNWQITEGLRLANPFRAGPAGPAGLELSYALGKHWEVAAGGAYRAFRFRLDENGPVPSGIGQSKLLPVFARFSYKFSPRFQVDLYGGASFVNKLRIDNSAGDQLYNTKYDVAPLAAVSLTVEF